MFRFAIHPKRDPEERTGEGVLFSNGVVAVVRKGRDSATSFESLARFQAYGLRPSEELNWIDVPEEGWSTPTSAED